MTKDTKLRLATGLFAVFAVLYFLASSFRIFPTEFNWFKAIPLTVLAIFSVRLLPWQMSVAMFCAAAGDFFGEMKYTDLAGESDFFFILQMGAFAAGHVFIVLWLLSLIKGMKEKGGIYWLLALIPPVAVVFAGVYWIIPHVSSPLCWGVMGYMVIIALMWWAALLQKDLLYIAGACFFVLSDFILAWNLFVNDLPASTYLIMVPYFLAEYLLFIRSSGITPAGNR